jgi:ribonuclease VapC
MIEEEVGHRGLLAALVAASEVGIGAPTLFEAAMVLIARKGTEDRSALFALLWDNEVAVIPFDARHNGVAIDAFSRYGKGRHPARLNFGDCMTYATAKLAGAPLLYVGGDFAKTDLAS